MPSAWPKGGPAGALTYGVLEVRPASHRVCCNGYQLHLSPIEFNLLFHLIKSPGKLFSREELIAAAWPDNIHVGARAVDVHISRLRKALLPHNIIRTVRSAGYALKEHET
ncbi:winged helix-turn-helix domain-containing protein [Bradyrhizobium sp. USDA 336]|uniref:winged helix-turn-helix domain-containing protein n=1 Tax=Bradyrhizobium sp. USDA 336 TaxID=3156311 RepID=UPI0038502C12